MGTPLQPSRSSSAFLKHSVSALPAGTRISAEGGHPKPIGGLHVAAVGADKGSRKADYYADDCTQDEAREYVQNAKVIVESLLGAGCCDDQ